MPPDSNNQQSLEDSLFSYAETGTSNDNYSVPEQEETQHTPTDPDPVDNASTKSDTNESVVKDARGSGDGDETQPKQATNPEDVVGPVRVDKQGNLVDSKGSIVATAGVQRRWFEGMQRERNQRSEVTAQLEHAKQLIAENRVLNGQAEQYGLNNEETRTALYMISEFKKDPMKVVQSMLTELTSRGYDISALTGQQSQIDSAGIQELIKRELAPMRQAREQEDAQVRAQDDARTQITQFYGRYPDAQVHENVLANMISSDKSLSLHDAYVQLYKWSVANQLDFNQPLEPQIKAARERQPAQAPTNENPRMPIPRGNTRVQDTVGSDGIYADPNSSNKDIIRMAMRDAGMNPDAY